MPLLFVEKSYIDDKKFGQRIFLPQVETQTPIWRYKWKVKEDMVTFCCSVTPLIMNRTR